MSDESGAGERGPLPLLMTILDQIDGAVDRGFYIVAVMTALAMIEVAAALEVPAEDTSLSGQRYRDWVTKNLPKQRYHVGVYIDNKPGDYVEVGLDGRELYRFRCAMLHEGRTRQQHPRYRDHRDTRVAFVAPWAEEEVHHVRLQMSDGTVHVLNARRFCNDVTAAIRRRVQQIADDPVFRANLGSGLSLHPEGIPPHIRGVPVIT